MCFILNSHTELHVPRTHTRLTKFLIIFAYLKFFQSFSARKQLYGIYTHDPLSFSHEKTYKYCGHHYVYITDSHIHPSLWGRKTIYITNGLTHAHANIYVTLEFHAACPVFAVLCVCVCVWKSLVE